MTTTKHFRAVCVAALTVMTAACEVSQDQEVSIGEQTAQEISAQLPLVQDPYVNQYISELGDTIAKLTSRSDLDWHFAVVNSHQVNAFALPGGYIYVNRGLIESTEKVDELAGVLGHEIGHVIQRHSVDQMQSQQKIGVIAMLACTLTDLCNSGLGEAAINIGGSALIARHSRRDEFEADSEAVENVLRVNIDPAGVPALFEVLMAQRRREPTIVDGWFASHPLEESRIANARRLIEQSEADQASGLLQDLPSYRDFKRRVAMLPEPPQPQRLTDPDRR
ncbi:MAG: M48 family metalloprotease [Gemmatimonadaceae bacterium]|nr:M48 family metalloprotease [Gemmatimonadaceae bacterium]